MKVLSLTRTVMKSRPLLMLRTIRLINELYRGAFVSTAVAEGVYAQLRHGPQTCESLHDSLQLTDHQRELEIWLDLGVSLGELGKDHRGYWLKSRLSKMMADPANDALHGFLQARVEVLYDYIVKTPAALREGRRFEFDDTYGEVFARSSRTVEPLLDDIVARAVATDPARLLEVGCGSGIYIAKACALKPALQVVGLEQSRAAAELARANVKRWQLEDRVRIETVDVRDFEDDAGFDVVTLYNLIYYFPEARRVELLTRLLGLIRPGGWLVLTTLTPRLDPSTMTMNLWSSMTEGCGPLPDPDQLATQLREAGFSQVRPERVFSSNYLLVLAQKSA